MDTSTAATAAGLASRIGSLDDDVGSALNTKRQQPMTLLQRAVINRLRKAGYNAMADAADDRWSYGERVEMPNMVSESELRADFERANQQDLPP